MDDPRLSYSSMTCYEDCPMKWKLRYIDKKPQEPKHFFSFGKTMHSVMEAFHLSNYMMSIPDMVKLMREFWLKEGFTDIAHEAELWEQGIGVIEKYHALYSDVATRPKSLYVELEFNIRLGGVRIKGFLDRVDEYKGGVKILDYKTGKPFKPGRMQEDRQLTMYQAACEKLEMNVTGLALFHLNSGKEYLVGPRSKREVQAVIESLQLVANGIIADKFEAKPEKRKCNWCDYKMHCPDKWGKTR